MSNNIEKKAVINVKDFLDKAILAGNYEAARKIAGKPYNISEVEKCCNGVIIGKGVLFGPDIKPILDFIYGNGSPDFIIISNDEDLEHLKKYSEEKIKRRSDESSVSQIESDEQIRDTIKETIKKATENSRPIKSNIEDIFNLVKEAEGKSKDELKELMGKVFKSGFNQSETTDIFKANPNLKINKNTFVVSKDVKNKDEEE